MNFQILTLMVTVLCFVYKERKDISRHGVQFHNSNIGKKVYKILSFVVSFAILITAFFLAIGFWIVKFNGSTNGFYLGLAVFSIISCYSMYFLYSSFKSLEV